MNSTFQVLAIQLAKALHENWKLDVVDNKTTLSFNEHAHAAMQIEFKSELQGEIDSILSM